MSSNKRQREKSSEQDKTNKCCKCGSTEHQWINHKDCPHNPKNNSITPVAGSSKNPSVTVEEENLESISVTSQQNIQNMVSALCLMRNHDVSWDSEGNNNDMDGK